MSTATHHPVDWVRIEKYCEITGETSQSVKNKRTTGIWREGVEFEKKADGVLFSAPFKAALYSGFPLVIKYF